MSARFLGPTWLLARSKLRKEPDRRWSLQVAARAIMLSGIFDLGYKAGDSKDREISIAFVTHVPAKGLVAPKNGQST